MANRFQNPFEQFLSSTPAPYSGGILRFYASGTSTPLAVYSDADLSVSIGTTVTLNSAGRPSTAIFLSSVAYKVTLEDSNGTLVWTADPVFASDYSARAIIRGYNGNPNGLVAGTAGSATTGADAIYDYTNLIFYVCTQTGTALTAVWTAVNTSATSSVPPAQGRLTLTSGNPATETDVTGATAVYYMPYEGNLVPIYNGSSFAVSSFSELTLTLVASHAANTNYDVFVFSNSGVVTLATGPAWSSATARGSGAGTTQISRVNGVLVNTVSMTGRNGSTTYTIAANSGTYLGTFRTNGSNGQTEDSLAKRFLWNMYHRRRRSMKVAESTPTWQYTTATYRQANGATGNQLAFVVGQNEDEVHAVVRARAVNNTSTPREARAGIGIDSTTTNSATLSLSASATDTIIGNTMAEYEGFPGLGYRTLVWLEMGVGTDTLTWSGTSGPTLQTGIAGIIST